MLHCCFLKKATQQQASGFYQTLLNWIMKTINCSGQWVMCWNIGNYTGRRLKHIKKVLAIKEEEPQSYRDLALAYEKAGNHQMAVDLLYKVITKNFYQYESRYRGIKSLMLNEMNAIINLHPGAVCLTNINEAIIKPLPADIRIVVDWNKDETDIDLHIEEPNGENCYYGYRHTKKGGRLSEDFTQGYGPEEYEIKQAQKGKYVISVNYYGDRYQKQQTPSFIKLTIIKNFGRSDQTIYTESIKMDNLSGKIEIGEVTF